MRRLLIYVLSLPLAIPVFVWAWFHQLRILSAGRRLGSLEYADAKAAGVRRPERVRVLPVGRVPNPFDRLSGLIARLTGYSIFNPSGMTLHYGIYVVEELEFDRSLLVHEFVHVAQYERMGMYGFMCRYIFQCLADDYWDAPLEIEAREVTDLVEAASGYAPDGAG